MDFNGKCVRVGQLAYRWGEQISDASIDERKVARMASKYIGAGGYLLALLFLALGIIFTFFEQGANAPTTLSFWLESSKGSLFFFTFGLLLAFSLSHRLRADERVVIMPKFQDDTAVSIEEVCNDTRAVNIAELMDEQARSCIDNAFKLAERFTHKEVEPLHIFISALEYENSTVVMSRLNVSFEKLKDALGRRLAGRQLGEPIRLSSASIDVILNAFISSYKQERDVVVALELLAFSYEADDFLQEALFEQGIADDAFSNMVEWIRIHERVRERYERFNRAALLKPTGPMNRAMTSIATPVLDAFSEDLTTAGVEGRLPIMIGREQEVSEIFRVIEGGRQSVVLVGPDGVGKTAILSGIAQLMVEERVPEVLRDKRLVRLSVAHLIAGANVSVAQERLLRALSEVVRAGNIILAVADVEQLVGNSSDESGLNLASTLVDFLSRGGTFVIATTTPRAYSSVVEKSILSRVFQKVDVDEPEHTKAIHILESKIGGIEYSHNVIFTYEALKQSVELSDRYIHEQYLPKKAIEIARETAQFVAQTRGKDALVNAQDIAKIVAEKTHIPLTQVDENEKDKLIRLEELMHKRMVGQDEAVRAVASALRRARVQLKSKNRPIATFLFLGPTGVGKTELTKTIAEAYFGDEFAMARFDMSEYQDTAGIQRLIGDGQRQGTLTGSVRAHPFSIVLLDEFEKASSDVRNLFLQVFDDGRLTDADGRTVDFTNAILIATSNAGTTYIQDAIKNGEEISDIKNTLMEKELRGVYPPELLNRFDAILVFKPLSQEEIALLARRMVVKIADGLEAQGIHLRVSEQVIESLSQKGYDPMYGARPLRRVIQESIEDKVAEILLGEEVARRDTIVFEQGGVRVEKSVEL